VNALPLSIAPDVSQIDRFGDLLRGQACAIVGAAPLRTPRAELEAGERVICVNGSISSVGSAPDLWLLNSSENRSALHLRMLQQAAGREARHVAFLRGSKVPTEPASIRHLHRVRCAIGGWSVIDKPIKRWLEESICDRPPRGVKPACSSGLFAAALALWCGAARVRLIGFSWKAGYHYVTVPRSVRRGHVDADRRALAALEARYPGRLAGALIAAPVALPVAAAAAEAMTL
jgi:hypothetical protein